MVTSELNSYQMSHHLASTGSPAQLQDLNGQMVIERSRGAADTTVIRLKNLAAQDDCMGRAQWLFLAQSDLNYNL